MEKDYTKKATGIDVKKLGAIGELELEYNTPLNLPQFLAAKGKTNQNKSLLRIKNLSSQFDLEVFIIPDPDGRSGSRIIPANTYQPLQLIHNWEGAVIHVTNVSQEAATAQVLLVSLTK